MRRSTIVDLINQIKAINDVEVATSFGPKHPDNPAPEKAEIMHRFFETFPSANADADYKLFIETYAGLSIYQPVTGFLLDVFGFGDASSSMEFENGRFLAEGESSVVEGNYLIFCDAVLNRPSVNHLTSIGTGFAFDLSGNSRGGIYRGIDPKITGYDSIIMEWYCENFYEWLELIIRYNGDLPYDLPKEG